MEKISGPVSLQQFLTKHDMAVKIKKMLIWKNIFYSHILIYNEKGVVKSLYCRIILSSSNIEKVYSM